MNKELKNKKVSVLLFCTVTVLLFFGCQTALQIEETMSQAELEEYGFRYYNPVIARAVPIDPQAETHYNFSPYVWVTNNPLKSDSLTVVNDKVAD